MDPDGLVENHFSSEYLKVREESCYEVLINKQYVGTNNEKRLYLVCCVLLVKMLNIF